MKQSVRLVLGAAVALTLLGVLPFASSPAHAGPAVTEIIRNSSTVQIVHNPSPGTDVLNLSIDVTNNADAGSCDGGLDDLLEGGVIIGLQEPSCATLNFAFTEGFQYVEHEIGSASYGTFYAADGATLSSKIVALPTPPGACGRWMINFRETGLDLHAFTSNSVGLLVGDDDDDAGSHLSNTACFDVNVMNGTGIVKPHHGVRRVRH